MISFDDVAQEVFRILRSYDYTVQLYDDDGERVYEPESARRFFAEEGLMVSLVDSSDNSEVRLAFPKSVDISDIKGLEQTLRLTANKYNLLFTARQIGRDHITPADFATNASVSEGKKGSKEMNILEGMYGTTRSSYLKLENARMIVRHSKKIDENKIGSRGRYVESIFVENAQGERFLFPTRQLAPARAMTQHVNQGGNFADAVGQQIGRMAQDFASLASASGVMAQPSMMMAESVQNIRENVRTRMMEMRKCFERLSRSGGYMVEAAKLEEQASTLTETADNEHLVNEVREALKKNECEELDETVIRAVAEAVRCVRDKGEEEIEEGRRPAVGFDDEPCPTCHGAETNPPCPTCGGKGVMTKEIRAFPGSPPVSPLAWDKLCKGKIDLFKQPSANMADPEGGGTGKPRFLNRDAELSYMLAQIVPEVKNDSLLSFLSWVSDHLSRSKNDPVMQRRLRLVAGETIKAAGMSVDEGVSPNNPVVREFSEWLSSFRPATALAEAGNNPFDPESDAYQKSAQGRDDAAEQVQNSFDPEDFLKSEDPALEFGWGDDSLDADERKVSRAYVVKLLASYLSRKVAEEYGEEDVDMTSEAESLYPDVEALLKTKEYQITESGHLDHEDVVIPTNQGEDLKREVEDPEVDPEELQRMRTLAGMPQNH